MASSVPRKNGRDRVLEDLKEWVEQSLREFGVSEKLADATAQKVVTAIAGAWGGQLIYIPSGHALKVAAQRQRIVKEFNGRNVAELAVRHGIAMQSVYRILKKAAAENQSKTTAVPTGSKNGSPP